MNKLIAICITAILCAAVIMAPLYYKTFFEYDYNKMETSVVSTETIADNEKYIVLSSSYSPLAALVLNKETGSVYFVSVRDKPQLIGNLK